MTSAAHRYWHELTTVDFTRLDPARSVAILPVAAIEQHGPHLPVVVDACINRGILARALALLPATASVLVLPEVTVGTSDEHRGFPGALSLAPETLMRVLADLGEGVRRAGLRKLVLFNSHGGNPPILDIVARRLRDRLAMLVVPVHWLAFGLPDGLFTAAERRHGIHGGAIETSLMLHLAPELVRHAERRDFAALSAAMEADYRHLTPTGAAGFAWQAQDLNPAGVVGDATAAEAAHGQAVLEHAAAGLAELLQEVERFPLTALRDTTT